MTHQSIPNDTKDGIQVNELKLIASTTNQQLM